MASAVAWRAIGGAVQEQLLRHRHDEFDAPILPSVKPAYSRRDTGVRCAAMETPDLIVVDVCQLFRPRC